MSDPCLSEKPLGQKLNDKDQHIDQLKVRLHWRFRQMFSLDVFAIDIHVFRHRY